MQGDMDLDCSDLLRNADVFWFREEAERFFAAFATDATLFHSTKGDAQVAQKPAIHPNRAGIDSLCDTMGAPQILCPNTRGEAVVTVIGVIDHFLFTVERRDRDDGAEDFLAIGSA